MNPKLKIIAFVLIILSLAVSISSSKFGMHYKDTVKVSAAASREVSSKSESSKIVESTEVPISVGIIMYKCGF